MFTIVIQAGGRSKRMGQDKALLPFLGEPLILRVINRISHLADEMLVTTNQPQDFSFLNVPLVSDITPGRGALGGLYTALSAATHNTVAILACDMPFINPDLIAAERDYLFKMQADLVVPTTENGMEPLHAVYRKDKCLQPVKDMIAADKWRVDSWYHLVKLEHFPLQEIRKSDPQLLSFKNVNTPQELEKAIRLAQKIDEETG